MSSLLIFVALSAIPCNWFAAKIRQAERQKGAVEALGNIYYEPIYDYQKVPARLLPKPLDPPGPVWLRKRLRDDFFRTVIGVTDVPDEDSGNPSREFTDDDMPILYELPRLQSIDILVSQVTDKGIERIGEFKELRELFLSRDITDTGLEHLQSLDRLESLRFYCSKISDDGLKSLSGLKQLKYIEFWACPISGAGLKHLKQLPRLERLDLFSSSTTDAGMAGVQELSQIKELLIADGYITDDGLKCLKSLTKLEKLDLRCNAVTDSGLEHIRGLTQLRSFSIGGDAKYLSGDGLKYLQGLPHLEYLRLGLAHISETAWKAIENMPNLRRLDLSDSHSLGHSDYEHIKVLKRLEELTLNFEVNPDSALQRSEIQKVLPNLKIK